MHDRYSLIIISYTTLKYVTNTSQIHEYFYSDSKLRILLAFPYAPFAILSLIFFLFSSLKTYILITEHIEIPYKYQYILNDRNRDPTQHKNSVH